MLARSTAEPEQASRRSELAFNILGTDVEVTADDPGDLTVSSAFMEAYAERARSPGRRRMEVRVTRSSWIEPNGTDAIAVHRTKHPYWSFDGAILEQTPRRVAWPSRRITCQVSAARLDIVAANDLPTAFASESIFHAIRSVALPLRDSGAMLHASGIVTEGRAMLFCGDVLAGKTTLMSEAVLRHGAVPLANDRVLLTQGAAGGVTAHSWPSYASYCEGTLLRYPELESAALEYERPECSYRTQCWPEALARTYDKNRKRIYPMRWFSDTAGCRYATEAPLGALVFPKLALDDRPLSLRRLANAECLTRLQSLVFRHPDPAFRPWHGIAPREPMQDPADLFTGAAVPAFEIVVPAATLSDFRELMDTIVSRWQV